MMNNLEILFNYQLSITQKFRRDFDDARLDFAGRAVCVNDAESFGFVRRDFQIRFADALVKSGIFLVHPVFLLARIAARSRSHQSGLHGQIEKKRQIRFQSAGGEFDHLIDGRFGETASRALLLYVYSIYSKS